MNQKCRAPFKLNSQATETFHNAFIAEIVSEVDSCGDVSVKVFFLNPMENRMKPCDFYFSGNCEYEENICKYSHGEVFEFSKLKPYKNPNFTRLKFKCHILAKTASDNLWKLGTVLEASHDQKTCRVKLQGTTFETTAGFENLLPPDSESENSDLSSDSESENDIESHSSLNAFQVSDSFGEWQNFTKGIGTKIMEKLGFVKGKGLGKNNDGRTEPVSARIYIQGKSLDYNMEQNEKQAQKTVEEKIKKESLLYIRHQKNSEAYNARNENVFSLINSIAQASTSSQKPKKDNVKVQSKTQLNIANFKIEEELKKRQKELEKMNQTLKRHGSCSAASEAIKKQLSVKQKEINDLQLKQNEIILEQKLRKDKLTIF